MDTPPPPYATLPPPVPNKDADNLRTLAIFHYVMSGLSLLLLGFLALHFMIMKTVFADPKMWENAKEKPPFDPQEVFGYFQWFYLFAGVCIVAAAILTFISGRFLSRRVNRTFSTVVAGLNCLNFPFGTVLGVFTLVVLTKQSVARLYEETASGAQRP